MKKRDLSIDALKAFAIFLVVLGHYIQSTIQNYDDNYLFKLIYSFHMPLFIFISGYLSYNINGLKSNYLNRRFISLIIPYLSWMVVSSVFLSCTSDISYISLMLKILYHPDYGLWFLWVLFWMHVTLYCSYFISKKHHLILFGCFIVSFLLITMVSDFGNIFAIKSLASLLPYFILGYILNILKDKVGFVFKVWYLILPLFLVLVYFWKRNDSIEINVWFANSKIFIYMYKVIVALLGIIISFGLFKYIRKYHNAILYTGENSIAIYAMNLYGLLILKPLYRDLSEGILFYLYAFSISVIVICICLVIDYILKKSSFMSFLFIGNRK